MNDLVSVIILTWNRVELLKETISSILSQTYQNIEILIVDNESTDGTSQYISSLSNKKVKYFRNPNNGILSVNRNYGIKRSHGSYIAFCDDDDLWLPNKLAKQMDLLSRYPQYKVVCANGIYFDDKGDIGYLVNKKVDTELTLNDFLKGKSAVMLPSVLINKEIFSEIGLYNEDPHIVTTEDYEFMVRAAARRYPIYFINECLVKYRIHDFMTSHTNTLMTIDKEKIFFSNLYEKKILNQAEYTIAKRNLSRKYLIANFKEIFKKSKIIKKAVYLFRRLRLKISDIDKIVG